MDGILSDARSLHELVEEASDLAEKVSSKVRLLDVTKVRQERYAVCISG